VHTDRYSVRNKVILQAPGDACLSVPCMGGTHLYGKTCILPLFLRRHPVPL